MKILLVDDDIFLRDMYATKFTESGDEVDGAEDGEEALRMIASNTYDVVILDMVMPGMSGIELLKEMKNINSKGDTKAIVLSNQGEGSDIKSATDLGVLGYIIKAETIPSEVVEKVHKLVS